MAEHNLQDSDPPGGQDVLRSSGSYGFDASESSNLYGSRRSSSDDRIFPITGLRKLVDLSRHPLFASSESQASNKTSTSAYNPVTPMASIEDTHSIHSVYSDSELIHSESDSANLSPGTQSSDRDQHPAFDADGSTIVDGMEEDDASEAVESQSGSDKEDENNESDLDDDQIIVDRTSKARKSARMMPMGYYENYAARQPAIAHQVLASGSADEDSDQASDDDASDSNHEMADYNADEYFDNEASAADQNDEDESESDDNNDENDNDKASSTDEEDEDKSESEDDEEEDKSESSDNNDEYDDDDASSADQGNDNESDLDDDDDNGNSPPAAPAPKNNIRLIVRRPHNDNLFDHNDPDSSDNDSQSASHSSDHTDTSSFSNDEMDPNMIRAAQGMIDGYFPPLSAVFAAAFNLQVVPDDTIDIAPPGCTLAPGQVVGPASLGKPDVGLLAFFIIRTSDGKGFVKYYSGLEKGLKGIDWDSPTEISKLNKWRHEVVRIEVEEEVTYGKIFKEVTGRRGPPPGSVIRAGDDMLAAYSSPYPQSRFLDEDDNYKPIVQPQIHVNDLPPPRVVHNRPDTRNFFIVAVRKSDDVGHIRVYPRWNGFDWADRKLVVHTLRPWRSQALGRLFKDYYGAEVVWQDKHSGRIV